jgi:ABC-type multidrug transport system fused ATPase/permease subunit
VSYILMSLVGTLVILTPATAWLSKKANIIQTELMSATDDRVNMTNEVLQGIRIIKYFSWETQFEKKIEVTRSIELRKYVLNWLVYAGFGLLSYGGGVIISFTTFGISLF